jgi:L-2-hydroxyglutarate oxidase LhgO
MKNVYDVEILVIGAGVVGLAIAREFATKGHQVIVIESHGHFGTETSSRNSEVIHAGIYYPKNSLKARFCVEGKTKLYEYCKTKNIPHKQIGKLIVATTQEQAESLDGILKHAADNGVSDLEKLGQAATLDLEPALNATASLYSPSTGIIDSHSLMLSFVGDIESNGGNIAYHTNLQKIITRSDDALAFTTGQEDCTIKAKLIINCAGLNASKVAKMTSGLDPASIPETRYARGDYYSYTPKPPFQRLIYPLPEPGGLGTHLTWDMAGNARFGPNVTWIDSIDYSMDTDNRQQFADAIHTYYQDLDTEKLQPAYAGIRPKIAFGNKLYNDFVISTQRDHGVSSIINLFGIESPGLTSCLAISSFVYNCYRSS